MNLSMTLCSIGHESFCPSLEAHARSLGGPAPSGRALTQPTQAEHPFQLNEVLFNEHTMHRLVHDGSGPEAMSNCNMTRILRAALRVKAVGALRSIYYGYDALQAT